MRAGNRAVNKTEADPALKELPIRVGYVLNNYKLTICHVFFSPHLFNTHKHSELQLIPGSHIWKLPLNVS